MSEVRVSKFSRIVSAVLVTLVLALAFAALGKTFAYFNTGAEHGQHYLINTSILDNHNPKVTWMEDDIVDGRVINEYMRGDLEKAYLQAWHIANLSLTNKDGSHLQDCFADQALVWIQQEVEDSSNYIVHQIDLQHNLQLHHFTLDNQLAAFTDDSVKVKKKIVDKDGVLIYEEEKYFQYDVVMVLDDGRWRIKHMVKKVIEGKVEPISLAKDQKMLAKLELVRGVNYYPASTPWFDFWESFDTDTIRQDLELAKASGFNTTRIFLQYDVFGGATVRSSMLNKLQSYLDISEDLKLKAVVTLFDFPKSYEMSNYSNTDRHLEAVLSRFKNHKAILAWDLKNEPDLDFNNYGQSVVTDWLSFAIGQARKYDPNHLVTVGWSDASVAHHLHDQLDFVSFHFYKKPNELPEAISSLKQKVKGKKIMLGEFGQTSLSSLWTLYAHSESNQATYYSDVLEVLTAHEVSFISWSLLDFEHAPSQVFGNKPWIRYPQKHYGLYRSNRTQKPVLAVLRK